MDFFHQTWNMFFSVSVTRSTDYGSTYIKLNDKVGSRTVLSYLYVCPTNKQKVSTSLLLYPCLISYKLNPDIKLQLCFVLNYRQMTVSLSLSLF